MFTGVTGECEEEMNWERWHTVVTPAFPGWGKDQGHVCLKISGKKEKEVEEGEEEEKGKEDEEEEDEEKEKEEQVATVTWEGYETSVR